MIGAERFFEVYVSAPLEVCRERDPNGMYERAERGELAAFPGVSAPYDEPVDPELLLATDQLSVDECVDRIVRLLEEGGILGS